MLHDFVMRSHVIIRFQLDKTVRKNANWLYMAAPWYSCVNIGWLHRDWFIFMMYLSCYFSSFSVTISSQTCPQFCVLSVFVPWFPQLGPSRCRWIMWPVDTGFKRTVVLYSNAARLSRTYRRASWFIWFIDITLLCWNLLPCEIYAIPGVCWKR